MTASRSSRQLGECIETQIDLFACRRCSTSSARRLVCKGRGPKRCRFGLFHGKRVTNREWRAAGPGGDDRRPSVISVRIQDSSYQSPQRTLGGGHGQRSRPLCAGAHCRCDAGGGARSRFFRACAGYGRARIGAAPQQDPPSENAMDEAKLERFSSAAIENRSSPGALITLAIWSARRSARSCVVPTKSSPAASDSRRAWRSARLRRRSASRRPGA
jgi:hypothetical protein